MDREAMLEKGQALSQMAQGLPIKKFNASWKVIFFGCGLAVVLGSVLGVWCTLDDMLLCPFDMVVFVYLFVFGTIMLLLDAPINSPVVERVKLGVYKYMLFLTRFMGRGMTYIFLGCMLCGSLWDNNVSPLLGFILFAVLAVIGSCALFYGWKTTRKLTTLRSLLKTRGPTSAFCGPEGLKLADFNQMALKQNQVGFTQEELLYVANALSMTVHADDVISQREFENWVMGETPVFL